MGLSTAGTSSSGTSSNGTGINFSGLASGIDTASIVTQLVSIAKQPLTALQNQATTLQNTQNAYNTVSAAILGVQASSLTLNALDAFNVVQATTSNATATTVTATAGAQIGQHDLVVNTLATTQKLASKSFASQSAPLGFDGQIVVNGQAIQVRNTDTLQTLAGNINSAHAGVTASIISPTANSFILTLGSNTSGAEGQVSLSDAGGGTFLSNTLGIFGSGTAVSNPIGTTGAASANFKDSATSVGTLLGLSSPPAGTVQIAGQNVNIDLSVDSLSGVAAKINAASITGVTASVVSVTDPVSQTTKQQLQINGTQSFTDSNNVLSSLGVVQQNFATGAQLSKGSDATFTIDGLSGTRPSNSITDLVQGVTINLLQGGGAESLINVTPDTTTISSNINSFVTSYNSLVDTTAGFQTFDSGSGATGPLFGDVTTQNVLDGLTSGITGQVAGVKSSFGNLADIGITLDQTGHLNVDSAALTSALTTNLSDVASLFRANGTATNPLIRFVSGTSDTQPSGSAGYDVNITQPAEQATATAATAQTQPLAQDETLTFGGSLFGAGTTPPFTNGQSVTIRAGSSLADVVSAINGNPNIGSLVAASINSSGKLQINSRQYGGGEQFSVISSVPDSGSGDDTGIGNTVTTVTGADVAGTINGETATGSGQFLSGTQSGGKANGLQIQVTGTTAGDYGNITYTQGVAQFAVNTGTADTDPTNGVLTQAVNAIQDQLTQNQTDQTNVQAQIQAYQDNLNTQFTAMETAVANIKSASAGLSALAAIPVTTTSTSSTGL